ncbi:MAG: DoxX family protein [Bacteroidota bacterium]
MKKNQIIYWTATGIMSFMFIAGGLMYFFQYEHPHGHFINLGFPVWLIYPLAVLKILGVVAILTKKSSFLKELAYAGFLYDVLLAFVAHIMIGDEEYLPALVAMIVISISWIYDRKVFGAYTQRISHTRQ